MLTATEHQPLTLVMRADLTARPLLRSGRRYWVLKDPISLRYHQLRDEEYTVLQSLDGTATLASIRSHFEAKFAPVQLSLRHLQALLGMLHQQGLVHAQGSGQGIHLSERYSRQRWRRLQERFSNPLAIRFRGVDPQRFLDATYPYIRWCFQPLVSALVLLIAAAALLLLITHFDTFQDQFSDYQSYFIPSNLLLLAIVIAVTKILHELGHAYACKHFGGECHEIGLLLLVFTPCLYCNVSDAWMLPNKWHRILVSAAGICVELCLASVATFLWYFSEPGLFHSFCFYTMLVCSVGTVLFNANPLLRYDGYFIFADWLDIPNLWQRSREVVADVGGRLFFGKRYLARSLETTGMAPWMFLYGLASILYLYVVLTAILWFVWNFLEPLGLRFLADLFILVVVLRVLLIPAISRIRSMSHPVHQRRIDFSQMLIRGAVASALLTALLLIPLPHRVVAPMTIEPADADRMYVTVAGTLRDASPPGSIVREGAMIARLDAANLEQEIVALQGELASKQARLRSLETLRAMDLKSARKIPAAREAVQDTETRLQQRLEDQARLTLRATRNGTVLAPPQRPTSDTPRELSTWQRSPLDLANRGCFLDTGTLCCLVGDPASFTAELFVHQNDVEWVTTGQTVRIRFEGHAGEMLTGQVDSVSKMDADAIPPQLARQIATRGSSETIAPLQAADVWYQARVTLDDHPSLIAGTCGQAKIMVNRASLGWRIYRYLRRTFAIPV